MIPYTSILKILPYVTDIASIVTPIFTKSNTGKTNDAQIESTQITELQVVAGRNSEAVKNLASDIKTALKVIGDEAVVTAGEISKINVALAAFVATQSGVDEAIKKIVHDAQISKIICVVSVLISLVALSIAFFK